jgi:hypothetical protein
VLRDLAPTSLRRRVARAQVRLRIPTAAARRLPEFVIVGVQRAGTSSLFRYLNAHPQVRRPLRKEIDYFSLEHQSGPRWYRAHFPVRGAGAQSYDNTPQYFVHPLAHERAGALLPDARIVVAVRDPIARALSHHRHVRALGLEPLDLLDALHAEADRVGPDLARLSVDPAFRPTALMRFSYATRSRYGEQYDRWRSAYPDHRLHLFDFDRFVQSPVDEWRALLQFLELDPWDPPAFTNWSSATAPADAPPEAIRLLASALQEDTDHFRAVVGRSFDWPDL